MPPQQQAQEGSVGVALVMIVVLFIAGLWISSALQCDSRQAGLPSIKKQERQKKMREAVENMDRRTPAERLLEGK